MQGEVYSQSICIVSTAAYMYYIEQKSQNEIARTLGISPATVSRVLKRAVKEEVVRFSIAQPYAQCLEYEKGIRESYHVKTVQVVPLMEPETPETALHIKKKVALEGSRYLQRIITQDHVLGLNWGGTMYYLIQYLNPCRKIDTSIVTMHGCITDCDEKFEAKNLVRRASMAFGGRNIALMANGYLEDAQTLARLKERDEYKQIFDLFHKIDISVSGVGVFYPKLGSALATGAHNYFQAGDLEELHAQGVYCDFLLRFIDENGQECESRIKHRTLSIDLEQYKLIPCKIVVASGSEKAYAVRALLRGGLVDVLIIDQHLAKALQSLEH